MPIARRPTPPTSQVKIEHTVLSSLSTWTDNETPDADDKKTPLDGYRPLKPVGESEDQPGLASPPARVQLIDPDHDHFNMFVGLVIIGNAVVIGLETDYGLGRFAVLEHCFNAVFCGEMVLRIIKLGRGYFKEAWNLFDFSLVIIGTLDLWVLPLAAGPGTAHFGYQFSAFRVLRMLRLMRVLRVIRLFRLFHQLFLILQAFSKAFQIVLLISLLILILDYVIAILATQAIGQKKHWWHSEEDQALIEIWFGTIANSMNTLFRIMTLSDWEDIAIVLVKVIPAPIVFLSFVGYIMVTSYTLVTLLTGIMTESFITHEQEFKRQKMTVIERKRKALAQELREFLHEMHEDDVNYDGCIAHDELKQSVRGDHDLLTRLGEIGVAISESGLLGLVDKLSGDGQNLVNINYFVDKLVHLTGAATASSLVDLKYDIAKTQVKMAAIDKRLDKLAALMFPDNPITDKREEHEKKRRDSKIQVIMMPSRSQDSLRPQRSIMKASGADTDRSEASGKNIRKKLTWAEE